jgi:hypothetical protein
MGGDFKSSLKSLNKQHSKNEDRIKKVIAPSNRTLIVEGVSERKQQDFFEKHQGKNTINVNKRTPKKKIINSLKLHKDWGVKDRATIHSDSKNPMSKVIIPRDRKVIIEGVNKFILGDESCGATDLKNIGYCNGKKLKELVFIINNEGSLDYTVELFNPSTPSRDETIA